jgi:hypothetical protein
LVFFGREIIPARHGNIISALMPVSCSLLRAKTTVGNWQVRDVFVLPRGFRQALTQKDLRLLRHPWEQGPALYTNLSS